MVEIFLTILTALLGIAVVGAFVSVAIAASVCVLKAAFKRNYRDRWWVLKECI